MKLAKYRGVTLVLVISTSAQVLSVNIMVINVVNCKDHVGIKISFIMVNNQFLDCTGYSNLSRE